MDFLFAWEKLVMLSLKSIQFSHNNKCELIVSQQTRKYYQKFSIYLSFSSTIIVLICAGFFLLIGRLLSESSWRIQVSFILFTQMISFQIQIERTRSIGIYLFYQYSIDAFFTSSLFQIFPNNTESKTFRSEIFSLRILTNIHEYWYLLMKIVRLKKAIKINWKNHKFTKQPNNLLLHIHKGCHEYEQFHIIFQFDAKRKYQFNRTRCGSLKFSQRYGETFNSIIEKRTRNAWLSVMYKRTIKTPN